jgi:hypothetical protein
MGLRIFCSSLRRKEYNRAHMVEGVGLLLEGVGCTVVPEVGQETQFWCEFK